MLQRGLLENIERGNEIHTWVQHVPRECRADAYEGRIVTSISAVSMCGPLWASVGSVQTPRKVLIGVPKTKFLVRRDQFQRQRASRESYYLFVLEVIRKLPVLRVVP